MTGTWQLNNLLSKPFQFFRVGAHSVNALRQRIATARAKKLTPHHSAGSAGNLELAMLLHRGCEAHFMVTLRLSNA